MNKCIAVPSYSSFDVLCAAAFDPLSPDSVTDVLQLLICRLVGPTMFRNAMLLRYVPCLITIPYHEWYSMPKHTAHMYLQDKLKTEGLCSLPDFVVPE